MATLSFDRPKFNGMLADALAIAADDLDAAFTATIESSIFPWPNDTRRRNGETVGSPRDIVDTGDFRASQSYSFPNSLTALFLWNTEYALIIFYGYTTSNGVVPGRDWVRATFNEISVSDIFADAFQRVF